MYTQCKVSNRLTPSGLCRMIPDVEDIEVVEEVKEDLAEDEDR